jgi:hypothetical protein
VILMDQRRIFPSRLTFRAPLFSLVVQDVYNARVLLASARYRGWK